MGMCVVYDVGNDGCDVLILMGMGLGSWAALKYEINSLYILRLEKY